MKIEFVTFTGADDSVPISDLVKFSKDRPNVEWGLLLSLTKKGSPRYPTPTWLDAFVLSSLRGSGHLCGKAALQVAWGSWTLVDKYFNPLLAAYQINLFGTVDLILEKDILSGLNDVLTDDVIIQADGVHDYMIDFNYGQLGFNTRVLYDKSGGNGKLGIYKSPHPKYMTGYAGGLNPDNIAEELKKIEDVVGDHTIWIDMETGVRSNEMFDLDKCKRVYDLIYSRS